MRANHFLMLSVFLLGPFYFSAQHGASPSPSVQKYVRVNALKVALEHARDRRHRTSALEDQNAVIEKGKITARRQVWTSPQPRGQREEKILATAEDSRSLALVLRDCILQVFPRLFPSDRPHPAVR
jgi:hypothetical protein